MTAQIIDGKQVAADMRAELKEKVAELKAKGVTPGLAVVLVGDDPASKSYVTAKERACEEIGIYSNDNRLAADTSEEDLLTLIDKLNKDSKVNGILVQLPLPKHIDEDKVLLAIDPAKDVDGFHPVNVGKMVVGQDAYLPCTPHGVIQLLLRSNVKLEGAEVVVVGRSNIVGKPVANMLIQKSPTGNATVTVCHTRTKNMQILSLPRRVGQTRSPLTWSKTVPSSLMWVSTASKTPLRKEAIAWSGMWILKGSKKKQV
jgi:methylenetetrahydrofolate dehydrogenase (NADP+)/methenyltetrahydrofolate cyclohydrolase